MKTRTKIVATALTMGLASTGVLLGATSATAIPNAPATATFAGFYGGSPWLHGNMTAKVVAFAKTNQYSNHVTCTGYTSGPLGTPDDVWLARKRATVVCNIIKAKSPVALTYSIRSVNTNSYGSAVRRVVAKFDAVPN